MAKKDKEIKTNAVRIVAAHNIPYNLMTYDNSQGFVSGSKVAEMTGTDPETMFKTLVLVGHSKEHYVCVIPVLEELDLKKAAKHFGEKSVEMIHAKDITPLTGYVKGGCSPVGMKKQFKTAIHISAESRETIWVSGGKIGLQMELSPADLATLIGADFADIIK